jgi:CubicO group peptidase (beta-lactamase class C family)
MNHSALNMHYVNGISSSQPLPDTRALLKDIRVLQEPGTFFQYSGGGFLVLQYLIEILEKKPIDEITSAFLSELGLKDFCFLPTCEFKKVFPAFAAQVRGG